MTHLAAILGVLIISFSAILVRLAAVSPDTSAFFRTLYALPVLLALWLLFGRRASPTEVARGWLFRSETIALASGMILGLELGIWHRSIQWIGAGLSTVLANTQVIFVGLAAWALYGERPRRSMFLGIPLAFAGMVLVSGLGGADAYGEDPLLGTLLGLLASVFYALFLLLFRRSSRDEATPFGPFFLCTVGAWLSVTVLGGVGGTLELGWSWPAHGWLLALALGSQVVGWLLIAFALPRLPAIETSILLLLQPMVTVLWGLLIFGEDLSTVQWLGVTLVLAGVALPSAGSAMKSSRVKVSV